jgi:hypothetical protein
MERYVAKMLIRVCNFTNMPADPVNSRALVGHISVCCFTCIFVYCWFSVLSDVC